MTEMGRRVGTGDMLKSVYDPNLDGVIALAQTQADMTKAVYDPVVAAIQALAAAHKTQHQNGGTDEINATGLTGVPVAPLLLDGVAGRVLRLVSLTIDHGTTEDTLKCTLVDFWNGDAIALTDNIPKNGTAGHFGLHANGDRITIAAAGLTGNCVAVIFGHIRDALCVQNLYVAAQEDSNNIQVKIYDQADGLSEDITGLVDTGVIYVQLAYITDG